MNSDMSESGLSAGGGNGGGFDPYRAWLNVRELRRPLNAYQLLGLPNFEEDIDSVRAAAAQQRVNIQSHRFEGAPEVWQQIHDELEDSIAVLLDPDRKTAYDASLRATGANDRAPSPAVGTSNRASSAGSGGGVRCSQCGAVASATRKFCANCGKHLWEPCFNCGTLSMTGEKFCGACGANLVGVHAQKIAQCEKILDEAEQLREQFRFSEAIALLGTLNGMDNARLEEQVRRAQEMSKRFMIEKKQVEEEASRSLEEAQRLAEALQYDKAIECVQKVPEPLRTDAMKQVIEDMNRVLGEVSALEREVRECLKSNKAGDLLVKVDRLLALQPDHAQARQLAGKLRSRLCQSAKEKVLQFQYDAAVKLLDQVPKPAKTPEVEALAKQAAELAFLSWDLRTAPFIDQPLVIAAERLARLMPKDPKAVKFKEEIQKRQQQPKDLKTPVARWASSNDPPAFGFPVEWQTGFERLNAAESMNANILMEHPGCFYVACGLALQGLGKTPMKTNLLPSDKGIAGAFSQLKWLLAAHTSWGLDLSSSGLKAVKLVLDEKKKTLQMEGCDYIEHRKLLSHAVNDEEERALVDETVRTFMSRNDVKGCRICLGLPSRLVFLRLLKMPATEDAAKLNSAVQLEARRLVPIPLDELAWGFERMESDAEGALEQSVVFLAAKRIVLKDRLNRLEAAGVKVDVVQSDCVALYNFLAYELFGGEDTSKSDAVNAVTVVADLGSDTTNIIIASPKLAWFYNSGFGSQSLTKALVREFQFTAAQAEQLKRAPSPTDSFSQFHSVAEVIYEDLVKEIKSAIGAFGKGYRHKQVTRMLAMGGMMQNHGLLRYMRTGK
jgi:type IV pilus assembly protein PilM